MSSSGLSTRSQVSSQLGGKVYRDADGLPNGILPSKQEIIECMMYLLRPTRAGSAARTRDDAALLLSHALIDHWEFCNVYTIDFRYVKRNILDLYKFMNMMKNSSQNSQKVASFNQDTDKLFDIFCKDVAKRKWREAEVDVAMGEREYEFLENMRAVRTDYCME